ncbi:MAG: YhbY family RNA-binding protein [Syntrophales bacterium]
MEDLKGFEKKYLRGLAHSLKPLVLIGKEGLTAGTTLAVDEALSLHELIKIKFNDFKESEQKIVLTNELAMRTNSSLVGMIGHTAALYRRQPAPEKRKIVLPVRTGRKQVRTPAGRDD